MTEPTTGRPTRPDGVRRVRRSRRERMIGGVCGGIAAAVGVDPLLLRIAAVALVLSGGFGVLAYILAWLLIPEAEAGEDEPHAPPADRHSVAIAAGACLIGLGGLLLRAWLPAIGTQMFWPMLLVASGVLVLVSARR